MPLVGALRRRFPQAFIAWVTQSAPATLLDGYPGLDELMVVPRDWLKSLPEIRRLRRELRARRFDVVIDPQSLTKSAMLGWLSGAAAADWICGAARSRAESLVEQSSDHPASRACGRAILRVTAADHRRARARRRSSSCRSVGTRRSAVFLDAVRFPHWLRGHQSRRRLGLETLVAGDDSARWQAIWAKRIVCRPSWCGLEIASGRGPSESSSHSERSAHLAPETNLPELAELMQRARLCVAADTGPFHLAAAVGTACVGLYGSTQAQVSGPYGPQHDSVQAVYRDGSSR